MMLKAKHSVWPIQQLSDVILSSFRGWQGPDLSRRCCGAEGLPFEIGFMGHILSNRTSLDCGVCSLFLWPRSSKVEKGTILAREAIP